MSVVLSAFPLGPEVIVFIVPLIVIIIVLYLVYMLIT